MVRPNLHPRTRSAQLVVPPDLYPPPPTRSAQLVVRGTRTNGGRRRPDGRGHQDHLNPPGGGYRRDRPGATRARAARRTEGEGSERHSGAVPLAEAAQLTADPVLYGEIPASGDRQRTAGASQQVGAEWSVHRLDGERRGRGHAGSE